MTTTRTSGPAEVASFSRGAARAYVGEGDDWHELTGVHSFELERYARQAPASILVRESCCRTPEVEAVEAIVVRWAYKPGWTVTCHAIEGGVQLLFRIQTTNSFPPHQQIELTNSETIPYQYIWAGTARVFAANLADIVGTSLMRAIDSVERHERDEWLRCNGQLLHDPHAEQRAKNVLRRAAAEVG